MSPIASHTATAKTTRTGGAVLGLASRWWFQGNWQGWWPRRFEWYFTSTRVGAGVRRAEEQGVIAALDEFLEPSQRAADIGAGTGHYTLLLARRCASVVAVDASPRMRGYLRERLDSENVANVKVIAGRLPEQPATETEVDVVVCVGVLQYVQDLNASVASLAGMVRPGGRVIFTVTPATREVRSYARQEFLGRRRIWLRTDPEIRQAAAQAELTIESLKTFADVTRLATAVRCR